PVIFETYADDFLCDAGVQSLNCKLQDKEQKSLVLAGPCVLKALHLLARDMNREVVFCMSFVQGDERDDKIPVALGLKEKNLYLSCVMKGDRPTLQLE
ncbi:Interleukin-1 beta, partial [Eschrichtius robustus]|nr:Interleukin-1 beta [Eschrichtius robustus]